MIIGLTGKNAAGKGVTAEYLKKKGFIFYSLSDAIRDELSKKGLEHSRDNMIRMGNELRKNHAPNFLAEQINKKIALHPEKDYVIDSIRNPSEAREIKKNKGSVLAGIEAPIELRFKRMLARNRIGDAKSVDELRQMEERENLNNESRQQLDKTLAMSDYVILNDGTFEELHKKIDDLLAKLKARI